MKNRLFFLAIGITAACWLSGCKPAPKPITEEEAYALLNEVILDDTLIMRDVYYRFDQVEWNDEMKKEFPEEEREFMEKQVKGKKPLEVRENKLIYFHRGYKKGDFVKLMHRSDSGFVRHISFPIISPDRKKLLIHHELDCNCMLRGSGSDDLYVKKNGRWKLARTFNGWIS